MRWWEDRATVTTMLGAVLAVGLGIADAGWLHLFDRQADVLLLGGAVGALLGHNPLTPGVGAPAATTAKA